MEKAKEKLHKQFAIQRNFKSVINILKQNMELVNNSAFENDIKEIIMQIEYIEYNYTKNG